ncbi:SPOR domain-containing protein [Paucibacter sp. KCTC 42545]|uniref:SPOR domain-containing protein n=1 Tax=Paucibacter sp. KCTC 42545 TaxID=1768242 RepID=UPI001E38837D|nr:SPOR domain-containing protein [Paucibacter sp. KCTC 42545]
MSDTADAVQQLRVRARRRLIGAAVLVAIGVIGFPLVFETQPRPIPVDLLITIPDKDGVPVLSPPPGLAGKVGPKVAVVEPPALTRTTEPSRPEPVQPEPPKASEPVAQVKPQPQPAQSAQVAAPKPSQVAATEPAKPVPAPSAKVAADKPVAKASEKAAEKQADRHIDKPTEKVAEKPADKPKPQAMSASSQEAARVQALLDGKMPPKPDESKKPADGATRVILQVGAYADMQAAQEARHKVEKLGLKTYTQEVNTPSGTRIRVRVGPFASREEADKAAAKVRATGLSTAVLTL